MVDCGWFVEEGKHWGNGMGDYIPSSDAHECEHIPVVAGDLHRAILPRQSQIWAVIRKTDSLKRICYTITNTLLGRMCLSGDVLELTDEQWQVIDNGIAFYKKVASIIKEGYSTFYNNKGLSDRKLTGWRAIVRQKTQEGSLSTVGCKEALVVVHVFTADEDIHIKLPADCPKNISETYMATDIDVHIENDILVIKTKEHMDSVGIYLN